MDRSRLVRTFRYYRNWLIMGLLFVVAGVAVGRVLRAPIHLLWAVPFAFYGSAVWKAYGLTHPHRRLAPLGRTPADARLLYEQVEFPSRDGFTLFGWYVPGRKRSAIALVHGAGSCGIRMLGLASALAGQGYGVLMFDLRAHGSSDCNTCTGGWREVDDLLGAVDYLQGRGDVDSQQIGVLGISMGGQVALRAAAQCEAIRGVVAEGTVPAVLSECWERPLAPWQWPAYSRDWVYFALRQMMSGERPPAGVVADIARISPRPVLLIAAGEAQELKWTRRFFQAAAEPKFIWEVPEAGHGAVYQARPDTYIAKCVALFEEGFRGEGRGVAVPARG